MKELFSARFGKELRITNHFKFFFWKFLEIRYLNGCGFQYIANLEAYTNVNTLFLQQNGLRSIQGLSTLPLRMLFLADNCIRRIENLGALTDLRTLDLAGNYLKVVENLGKLQALETLNLARNQFTLVKELEGCAEAANLNSLDVSSNFFEETEGIFELFASLELPLKTLTFHRNPNQRLLEDYRRGFIAALPLLTFLDDRPVP